MQIGILRKVGSSNLLILLFFLTSFSFKSGCQHLYNYEKSLETNAFQGFFH